MHGLPKSSRRAVLKRIAGAAAALPLARFGDPFGPAAASRDPARRLPLSPAPAPSPLSSDDDDLLDQIERAAFLYFWEQVDPSTGLVRDRVNVRTPDKSDLASIAATGFGFTALAIGQKRGFVPYEAARDRVRAGLRFLWEKMPNHRGFFFHWANMNTGERLWDAEVSSIDTSILLCGVLTCRKAFQDAEIEQIAHAIFNRVDWTWLSEDTTLLPHGWRPETGFLQYRWDDYSELMMLYLFGLGSYAHPLPTGAWDAWKRTLFEYDGIRYIGSFAPLFIHQYSQAWFDFRDKHDQYADYFQNSILATEVHRRFCLSLASKFSDYSDDLWGITASDSAKGYAVWGGPPATGPIDGTVVPSAAAGSVPFMPGPTLRVLRTIKDRYGERAWTRYGFVDAFNPLTNWYDDFAVGIDTGITLVMAENARTGYVWDTFMKNAEAWHGMQRAGFIDDRPAHGRPTLTGITGSRGTSGRAEERRR